MPRKTRFFRTVGCLFLILALVLTLSFAVFGQTLATKASEHVILPASEVPRTAPPATTARAFALFDPVSGDFLAEGNADERLPMASTTKIMTALVILEDHATDETVTVPREAVGIEGSSIYLFEGEEITVESLLYGLMLSSANDAAVALAIHSAGSVEAFAARMNEKSTQMGLENTRFCNPHGLPAEGHYTTARDFARLTAAALQNPTFAKIVATKRHSAPQNGTEASRLFVNHNKLLRSFEGAVGVKTGFTKASGRCLVSAATREGLTLVCVTLNDPNDWRDHTALLTWGFSQYTAFSPDVQPITVPVVGGTENEVILTPVRPLSITIPATHGDITATVEAPRFLFADVEAGEVLGRIVYRMGETVLGETPLVSETSVPLKIEPLSLWQRIKKFFER